MQDSIPTVFFKPVATAQISAFATAIAPASDRHNYKPHPNAPAGATSNETDVKAVFQQLFTELEKKQFKSSEMHSIQVRQLSDNQAIVSGSATRYNKDGKGFESFGLTYTLRQEGGSWKIIFGVLHEQVLLLTA